MKKRILVITMLTVLVLQLVTGCGGTAVSSAPSVGAEEVAPEATPATETVSSVAEPESVVEVEEVPEDNYTPISYPIETDDNTLSLWFLGTLIQGTQYSDYSEHHALALLEEKTGIKLELIPNAFQTGAANMDLMLASGDYADLIADFTYSTGMNGAVNDDVVVDLTPYLEEYAPDYYRYLAEDDFALMNTLKTDDDYIGVFVQVGTVPQMTEGPMTLGYMLEETGFTTEDLKTIDKYEEYLTAVKNKYELASPLYLPGDFVMDNNVIASGFDVALKVRAVSGELSWYVEDGQVKFGYLEDGFKEYVTRMHDWYEKGLMDSDTASHAVKQDDYIITAIASHQVAVFERPNGMMDMLCGQAETDVVALPYPSLDGEPVNIDGAVVTTTGENGTVITTGCDNVETAVMFMNYLYTEEYEIPSNYGIEGESYFINDMGEPEFDEWMYSEGRTVKNYLNDYVLEPTTMVNLNVMYPDYSQIYLDSVELWADTVTNAWGYPASAVLTEDESEIYSSYAGDIIALVQEHTAKFITGDAPLSEIDSFQEKLIATGVQNLIDVKQAAYDRYAG